MKDSEPQDGIDHRIQLLKCVELFRTLESAAISEIAICCRRIGYRNRTVLFREGETDGRTLFIVVTGNISIHRTLKGGELLHIADRGPGECVGEMALLDGAPRSATAVADPATVVITLDAYDFMRCVEGTPHLALELLRVMSRRLRESLDALQSLRSLGVVGKLARFLLGLDGMPGQTGELELERPITHQQVADRIGTARESVSRAFATLESSGAIIRLDRTHIRVISNVLEGYSNH